MQRGFTAQPRIAASGDSIRATPSRYFLTPALRREATIAATLPTGESSQMGHCDHLHIARTVLKILPLLEWRHRAPAKVSRTARKPFVGMGCRAK